MQKQALNYIVCQTVDCSSRNLPVMHFSMFSDSSYVSCSSHHMCNVFLLNKESFEWIKLKWTFPKQSQALTDVAVTELITFTSRLLVRHPGWIHAPETSWQKQYEPPAFTSCVPTRTAAHDCLKNCTITGVMFNQRVAVLHRQRGQIGSCSLKALNWLFPSCCLLVMQGFQVYFRTWANTMTISSRGADCVTVALQLSLLHGQS